MSNTSASKLKLRSCRFMATNPELLWAFTLNWLKPSVNASVNAIQQLQNAVQGKYVIQQGKYVIQQWQNAVQL